MRLPGFLQELILDESVTDVLLNGHDRVFIDRGEGLETLTGTGFSDADALHRFVMEVLADNSRTWDARLPFCDAVLPGGHRMHAVFPPVGRRGEGPGLLLSIRVFRPQPAGASLWDPDPSFETLQRACIRRESILISGATGSGKTTLLQELLRSIPSNERIIALEDTPELNPRHLNFVSLSARARNADGHGEVQLRQLLKQALRMRPDRIVVGECRGGEAFELLQSLNTGHRGALATLHGDGCRDALRRLELLCHIASGGRIPSRVIRELMASGLRWLVQTEKQARGKRCISEIHQVEGMEGDTILLRPVLIRGGRRNSNGYAATKLRT